MIDYNDIGDNEIRIIGEDGGRKPKRRRIVWVAVLMVVAMLAVAGILLLCTLVHRVPGKIIVDEEMDEETFFELAEEETVPDVRKRLGTMVVDSTARGFTEIIDTMVNDIPMKLYIPYNAEMSLRLGRLDVNDSTIVYAAQAADLRKDNHKIVGAFVLKGTPLSWGLSKKGFCACIDGKVTVGVSENSPLFEEATERGGYFFRQYPLVAGGRIVESGPKGKAIRRAICERQGEIFMAETGTPESFHDFSQALVDLGAAQAIYLVGSSSPYGWTVDEEGNRHEFGNGYYYRRNQRIPRNINYIVWTRK